MAAQVFEKPTCTVPDQYMTIAEIIARFTRAGIVPKGTSPLDAGKIINSSIPQRPDGEAAFDPDFDPMDNGQDFMEAAMAASHGSESAPQEPVSEPEPASEPGAGNGGA